MSVKKSGNTVQQAAALQAALSHPELQRISKSAGFFASDESVNAAIFQANQRRKLISTALATRDNRGHCNQHKASFVELVLTAIAPSPERPLLQQNMKTLSLQSQIQAVGFLHSTGVCKFKNAMKKREAVRRPNSKREGKDF